MKIAFIDHYDSFSNNLIDWFRGLTCVRVERVYFDDWKSLAQLNRHPVPLILSPGPNSPEQAQSSTKLVQKCLGQVPIFGVCLGHQILAHAFGGMVVRSQNPRHGSNRMITVCCDSESFQQMPSKFQAAAYNSLTVVNCGHDFRVIARCEHQEVQAMERVAGYLAIGVQFHPESFMSDDFSPVARRWLREVMKFFTPTHVAIDF